MILRRRIPLPLAVIILVTVILPGMENRLWSQYREKEKLLFEEIPVVITASRLEQPITEAPTTITVITDEDIRYSGATSIPDVLRRVAGVDVMTITARDQQVGIRGFVNHLSNKLLVLIDGRSVYMELYNQVFWDGFPVGLEEIDRIEVVKSPSSSLYGANAYSGVVNIITKSPEQLEGTRLHLTVGTRNTFIGSLLHAGDLAGEKIRYKISAEWDKTDEWSENKNTGSREEAAESTRLNALVRYNPNDKSQLTLSGGRVDIKNRKLLTDEFSAAGRLTNTINYLQLQMKHSHLTFRTYFRQEKGSNFWYKHNKEIVWQTSLFDAELVHTLYPGKGENFSLVWGANYRYNKLKKDEFFPADYHQHIWSVFIESDVKITNQLRLNLGGRYDRHPLVGGRFSPRGNMLYSPGEKHRFRFSVARAFHNPFFAISYLYIEETSDVSYSLPPPLPPLVLPFTFIMEGYRDLKPESITAYEIGYHAEWSRRLQLKLNLFLDQYSDFFINYYYYVFYEENELFPGSPGGIIPKIYVNSYRNSGSARGIGGEISLDFSLNSRISGFVNYSYQQITNKQDNPYTWWVDEKNRVRSQYPKHKINAGLRLIFKNGISLNLLAHWVDKTERSIADKDFNVYLAPLDDYFIFNARVGYTSRDERTELALSVFNLFNDRHYEYPSDRSLPVANSDRVGRRITFSLRVKF